MRTISVQMVTRIIILAAGKSKRMNPVRDRLAGDAAAAALGRPVSNGMNGTSKVLIPIGGQPVIRHLLDSVRKSGIDPRPVIVVGEHNEEEMRAIMGPGYEYVLQKDQNGTGYAVRAAESVLAGNADTIIVLYGDHPFVSSETIKRLNEHHRRSGAILTMMTTRVPDFAGWHSAFQDFGKIIRDSAGKIAGIVECKDAAPEELEIKEVNPALFCFNAGWLWKNLGLLKNHNNQGEYYLTDLVQIAVQSGAGVGSIEIDPRECLGINTPEQLEIARTLA